MNFCHLQPKEALANFVNEFHFTDNKTEILRCQVNYSRSPKNVVKPRFKTRFPDSTAYAQVGMKVCLLPLNTSYRVFASLVGDNLSVVL